MSTYFPYRRPSKLNEYGLKRVPDYTELAYKEAVSKLRYFLSGNYAPSVRSYGGSPSIKNLDESDGDLDKKYSSPYHALAEYKPRPRLTAKYATLYADSLHNYTPQHHTTTVPAPTTGSGGGDLSGGTNPDVVNFIQKQEEYIEQLERESQYCRDELNNLLGKVKEVISENEHLHEAQKNKLISRMFHSYNAGSETDELDDIGDSTGLDSDHKLSPSKGRRSAKVRSTKLEGPNIVFESRIAELEAQLTQAKIDLKKVQEENNENKRKLASGLVDSSCLDGFKRQIDNLQRDKSSLEAQISKLKLSLEQKDSDLDGRYKRGTDAVEQQLRDERNNLEAEIRRLKDDLNKERNKVREMAGEGARRAIQERSAAEQRYNAHFDELQHDLAAQYDNVAKLQLDLERQRREENDLKRELSMKNSAIDELKMELKNKTSSLQADLAQAHAEKASLDEELASARLAIERHQRQNKHETNRLNSEIQSLRQRLDRADADLVHSRRENLRLTEQIANLEKEMNMKNLTPISPEKKKDKELSTMLESMENKHAKTVAELECMIQSQNSLMEKLTGECRLLTDKLDDANRRHKEELATLQRQVDTLGRSLQPSHSTSPSVYQAPPTHASSTNRNVPHTQTAPRPDNSRDNTPGYPGLPDQGVADARPDSRAELGQPRTIRKQESRTSLLSQKEDPPYDANQSHSPENDTPVYEESANVEHTKEMEDVDDVKLTTDAEKPMEVEQPQEYEATNQNYAEGNYEQYDQNYEQGPVTSENEYQNQGYEQNYEQPAYTEGQYENYEQQPQYEGEYPQQYTDPNAQYENQYENYATDGNYQSEQSYDNTQNQDYLPQNLEGSQEYEPNQDPSQDVAPNTRVESQRNVSPKENIPSQS
ncbi:serologically defined colon cancer antigen 8 homolog [Ostrinia furnacalis]|uniref:serologically defined colon cancer antigen 8 homolog n=1 Tax=Ostrinia furnacalis TaxID=93504 RepID=UPI00103BB349|nr:serologically defined colon cancer antigen 8 homolog [Ostrinia furnacalis]